MRDRRALPRVAAALVLACLAVFGVAGTANAAPGDTVKVFVVGDQPVGLPAVAASTLGDPGRAGEILDLNRGLRQPDGGALAGAGDQLRPGWILRLPPDARGPDVQQARVGATTGTTVTVSLPAVLAVIAAILLALVTATILGRRRVGRWFTRAGRLFHALGEPARRRARLARRQALGARFATDDGSLGRAYDAVGEVAAMRASLHAVRTDQAGTTAWIPATDSLTEPWQRLDDTRWRRPGAAVRGGVVREEQSVACLVRVGADEDGEPVYVDLSLLDGVLSVGGDRPVARDLVQHLLTEIARVRPNLPVAVRTPAVTVPAGLAVVPQVPVPAYAGRIDAGPLRGAANRHPVRGLIVAAGTPDEREAAELLALCGTASAGWTGLVAGEVPDGAHWRWQAHADGTVELPVLGLRLTVPAPA